MNHLEEKINKKLLKEAGQLGYYSFANILEDYGFQQQLLKTEIIGDEFAELMGYDSFYGYVQEHEQANSSYFDNLKLAILNQWEMGLNDEDFKDGIIDFINGEFIELNPEQQNELIELIAKQP